MILGMALRGRHATPRRVCFLATVALLLFLKTADGAADGDAYKQVITYAVAVVKSAAWPVAAWHHEEHCLCACC